MKRTENQTAGAKLGHPSRNCCLLKRCRSYCVGMAARGRKPKIRPTPIEGDEEAQAARRKAIGERVRELRLKLGWSLHDLAARSSVTASDISRVEAGSVDPKTGTLFKLAKALDCTDQWLILGIE